MPERPLRRLRACLTLLGLFAAAACTDSATAPGVPDGHARLRLSVNTASTPVNTLVVEVTAPDLAKRLAFNLKVQNGVAEGSITVPAGSGRTVTLRAFDTRQIETHRGSRTLDVRSGTNPTMSINMLPLDGSQPIQAVLGSIVVSVSPAADTVAAGDTVRLRATIRDQNGAVVAGQVQWATLNAGVATVDAQGLVTGRAAGEAQIVAVYAGVAASARVVVTPAVALHHRPATQTGSPFGKLATTLARLTEFAAHAWADRAHPHSTLV